MVEYINKQDALGVFHDWSNKWGELVSAKETSEYKAIENIQAADVVEVVRCKDCKWCHAGYCEKYDDLIPFGCANKPWDDWFCADGEKKNG